MHLDFLRYCNTCFKKGKGYHSDFGYNNEYLSEYLLIIWSKFSLSFSMSKSIELFDRRYLDILVRAHIPNATYQFLRSMAFWFRSRFRRVLPDEGVGHLGHVTRTIWTNFNSLPLGVFIRNWSSICPYDWSCWRTDNRPMPKPLVY